MSLANSKSSRRQRRRLSAQVSIQHGMELAIKGALKCARSAIQISYKLIKLLLILVVLLVLILVLKSLLGGAGHRCVRCIFWYYVSNFTYISATPVSFYGEPFADKQLGNRTSLCLLRQRKSAMPNVALLPGYTDKEQRTHIPCGGMDPDA